MQLMALADDLESNVPLFVFFFFWPWWQNTGVFLTRAMSANSLKFAFLTAECCGKLLFFTAEKG